MTMLDFVLARVAEDEEAARAADHSGPRWMHVVASHTEQVTIDDGSDPWGGDVVVYDEGAPSNEQAAHIARHDPARVLAECQAKRRIVDLHHPEPFADDPALMFCAHDQRTAGSYPCQTMRLLAIPYADHPDYREEWNTA